MSQLNKVAKVESLVVLPDEDFLYVAGCLGEIDAEPDDLLVLEGEIYKKIVAK